jgi:hypothetical protein
MTCDASGYVQFEGLPVEIARQLLTGPPNVDPGDVQGRSPRMGRMVDIAAGLGGTVHGFAVVDRPHDESAPGIIVFEGFEVLQGDRPLVSLLGDVGRLPECLDEVEPGVWRFRWDEDPDEQH